VRPGAHSIPYYHNALGDPLWPPKTAGCAESSTEGDSTTSHDQGSTPKCAKPDVLMLAVLPQVKSKMKKADWVQHEGEVRLAYDAALLAKQ
jgi:hypothetical protein